MKLQTITLCDFRAFPGPGEYIFDFGNKDHLLIYGENGSGKTSVFKALAEFFDLRPEASPFGEHKNFFSDGMESSSLICGKVELAFREAPVPPAANPADFHKVWGFVSPGQPDNRLRTDTTVQQVSRRKGLLDYQALLRANRSEHDRAGQAVRPNLFDLMVTQLLAGLEVPTAGGTVRTIQQLWSGFQQTLARNQYFRGGALARIEDAQNAFNAAIQEALPRLKHQTDSLLSTYFEHLVELTFIYTGASFQRYRKPGRRTVENGQLLFDLRFRGRTFQKFEEVLNEAKLSAVALCVYFGALLDGIPKGGSGYPRILVLDDVLLGLDMQNRLPVLKILRDKFAADGWQIILLTHDKVWYDYASHAAIGLNWTCYELYADRVPDGAGGWHDVPHLRTANQGAGDYLKRAKEQMRLHDHKAAGMYARAAYERALKRYCDKRHLPIPFHFNADKISSNVFFQEVEKDVDEKLASNPPHQPPVQADLQGMKAALDDIKLHRQQVLNPMSHAPAVPLTALEVRAAIDSVETLVNSLQKIPK